MAEMDQVPGVFGTTAMAFNYYAWERLLVTIFQQSSFSCHFPHTDEFLTIHMAIESRRGWALQNHA